MAEKNTVQSFFTIPKETMTLFNQTLESKHLTAKQIVSQAIDGIENGNIEEPEIPKDEIFTIYFDKETYQRFCDLCEKLSKKATAKAGKRTVFTKKKFIMAIMRYFIDNTDEFIEDTNLKYLGPDILLQYKEQTHRDPEFQTFEFHGLSSYDIRNYFGSWTTALYVSKLITINTLMKDREANNNAVINKNEALWILYRQLSDQAETIIYPSKNTLIDLFGSVDQAIIDAQKRIKKYHNEAI